MAVVNLQELSIGFRGPLLLENVDLQIDHGQRIGLLGRNGAGKTTLMRILCGEVEPDAGAVQMADDAVVALLDQNVPQNLTGTIRQVVADGWLDRGVAADDWRIEHAVEQTLSRMTLAGDARFETLSSGMKRRALLARALVSDPDLLLLDEPTNHLDIDAINWLEGFLSRWSGTLMFITHDRVFLRKLANRILEIDRGQLFDWSCDYETFLRRKEAALLAQEKQEALFDRKLAEEEVWIRQGIKARRTRNEGRVRALEMMRRERRDRRPRTERVRMEIQEGQRSGNLVADVKDVAFTYDQQNWIFRDFSTTIMRGDKVGVVGNNGVGKTTLLRVLLGKLAPTEGAVRLGANLQIAYFDQLREQLLDDETVQESVGEGAETLNLGDRKKHVIGYLQDFLFTPERARTPIRFLSGGERNRVLLAKLFSKPANVIVLDEPTNDLDAETLELLESRLVEFGGTVLVVSHDREFLNNVVASTIVFEEGTVREYVGGYDDWLRQSQAKKEQKLPPPTSKRPAAANGEQPGEAKNQRRRLSFQEKQELGGLPKMIEGLEGRIAELHEQMAQAEFYQQEGAAIAAEQAKLARLEEDLQAAYQRYEELDEAK